MTSYKLFQAFLLSLSLGVTGCVDMDSSAPEAPPNSESPPDNEPAPAPAPAPAPEPEPEPSAAPEATTLSQSPGAGSQFSFSWTAVDGATFYRLYEQPNSGSGFSQVGADIPGTETSADLDPPVFDRTDAAYYVESCNASGCSDSNTVYLSGDFSEYIDYFKAPNSNDDLELGRAIAISGDNNTLVIGAPFDDSATPGINTTPVNEDSATLRDYGAVHVYVKQDGQWVYDAYIKPNVLDPIDHFGWSVSISDDGTVLAAGMPGEASDDLSDPSNNAFKNIGTTIIFKKDGNGDWAQTNYIKPNYVSYDGMRIGESVELSGNGEYLGIWLTDNESAGRSGTVWIYKQDTGGNWVSETYVKHPNPRLFDAFGKSLDFSYDGLVLAAGTLGDQSCDTTINGDAFDTNCKDQGSVSLFNRKAGTWVAGDYIKAPNGAPDDEFGTSVALSNDGTVLAVGAPYEKGSLSGINPSMADKSGFNVGAAYIFESVAQSWSFSDFIKPESPVNGRFFAGNVDLSGDGDTLLIGAIRDNSVASGINGNQFDESAVYSGGAYVLKREGGVWAQTAYLKAPNNGAGDRFATVTRISDDGTQIFIGAPYEGGDDTGINSKTGAFYDNPTAFDDPSYRSGAVYGY